MDNLPLPRPVLFLEFFVREVTFHGQGTVRTQLPRDAFFYTGVSKAARYLYHRHRQTSHSGTRALSFINGLPTLSRGIDRLDEERWFSANVNTALAISGEYLYQDEWVRSENQLKTNKYAGDCIELQYANVSSLTPYGFNLLKADPDGSLWTSFPRKTVPLKIHPQETLCFLCRREEFDFEGWGYQPNLNLVMFVKNHGFHQEIRYASQKDIDAYDSAALCLENVSLRDFRKSRLKYELG
ncbi:Uncharacterised protein [Leminorella richardii]|uniref:Uncharacterized protein n=1 Tax=Leminorella richardii TaxID=158841 RepID=A0A2X4XJ45_9GAMM|nr:hypothetical protein [Leminorella richardii]SQI36644.1 Uncharacterised protein [Leminorella richardii]